MAACRQIEVRLEVSAIRWPRWAASSCTGRYKSNLQLCSLPLVSVSWKKKTRKTISLITTSWNDRGIDKRSCHEHRGTGCRLTIYIYARNAITVIKIEASNSEGKNWGSIIFLRRLTLVQPRCSAESWWLYFVATLVYLFTRSDLRSPGNWRKARGGFSRKSESIASNLCMQRGRKRERERRSKKRQTNLTGRNAVHPSARVSCVNT